MSPLSTRHAEADLWKCSYSGQMPTSKKATASAAPTTWRRRRRGDNGGELRAVWINEDAAALGTAAILIDRDCKLRYRI
jgi:hypothetical protein